MLPPKYSRPSVAAGFSLVELMVAIGVLLLLLGVMLSLMNQTTHVWRDSSSRIDAYQSARRAFETLTRTLEQATLNTYWDYDDPNSPSEYRRKSELHLVVGEAGADGLPGTPGCGQAVFFQAPANRAVHATHRSLNGLLNACGFYVLYSSDQAWLPAHIASSRARERYRLMQWVEESEALAVFAEAGRGWIPPGVDAQSVPMAENVIALIIWPKEEGAATSPILNAYGYDSRSDPRPEAIHQLPPMMQIAMVAIDEAVADRLGAELEPKIAQSLEGLFSTTPSSGLAEDLATLEARLTAAQIPFRTFSSSVLMREARWSP